MSGRATAGGVNFQGTVGGCVASLLLTERPLARIGGNLPGVPTELRFETPNAVDDIVVTTTVGEVSIQAKRTISLSTAEDSELASVVDQFVRKFAQGVIENGVRRELDVARDRLVLAVGETTAATVRSNLSEGLDRLRTGAATAIPSDLQSALNTFSGHVDRIWLAMNGSPVVDTTRSEILRACSVVTIGSSQGLLSTEALRDVVPAGEETSAFGHLEAWASTAAGAGVGGNASAIRLALQGKVDFDAPPSFQADITRLLSYGASVRARLKRFTTLEAPEGSVRIDRPVTTVVLDAVRGASLALTGEPGAGKSAVMHDVAELLSADSVVVLLTVESSTNSLSHLASEIGLTHPILDVLKNIPGASPKYLVLDALDAARGGAAEGVYKDLMERVMELDGWRVLASVRTFDLKLGKDWRRLFRGTPPNQAYTDSGFAAVRHVRVGVLDEAEASDASTKSPSLAAALEAGGAKLASLARNVFNLALLGDLLKGGTTPSSLANVASRGELLERYWDERITGLGTSATVALRSIVDLMLMARAVDIPIVSVPQAATATVDQLMTAGVLVGEQTHRLGYRHHVLFDYAVARLVLMPDTTDAGHRLAKSTGAGLLIAPSLGYWLEHLRATDSPSKFWTTTTQLIASDETDPIVRIELARIATEGVQDGDDLSPLVEQLTTNAASRGAFAHLVGSVIIAFKQKRPFAIGAWSRFCALLNPPTREQLGGLRAVVGTLLDASPDSTDLAALGRASRNLFDEMSKDDDLIRWLAAHVIGFVATTFGTDLVQSKERLAKLLEPERFARLGHVEFPWLADKVSTIADHDGDFVVRIFERAFRGGDFSRDDVTAMSQSWILSLSSNAKQDFEHSLYSLSTAFPGLLRDHPRVGLRALSAALREQVHRERASTDANEVHQIPLGNRAYHLKDDHSHAWAWNIDDDDHDDHAKLYREAMTWVEGADAAVLADAPQLLLEGAPGAILWRILFDFATKRPEVLGPVVWSVAAHPQILASLDVRRSAIGAIAAAYPHVAPEERRSLEIDFLNRDFAEYRRPETAKLEVLGTTFSAIGAANLETEDAREYLNNLKADGSTFENRKPFEVHSSWGGDYNWLAEEGVDVKDSVVAPILAANQAVEAAIVAAKEDSSTTEQLAALRSALEALWTAFSTAASLPPAVDIEVQDTIADALGILLRRERGTNQQLDHDLDRLLAISRHYEPQPDADTEENFGRSASWGSPSPRVAAALSIVNLVGRQRYWPRIALRYRDLLHTDPHPAVRFQLSHGIHLLRLTDELAMLEVIDRFFAEEKNESVLRSGLRSVTYLRQHSPDRVEDLAIMLAPALAKGATSRRSDAIWLIVQFAIRDDREKSRAIVWGWIADFAAHEEELHEAVLDMRAVMLLGIEGDDEAKALVRHRAQRFLSDLMDALEPAVRSLPLSKNKPTSEETVALKMFGEIANQLFFAAGHDKLVPALDSQEAKLRLLAEYKPFISKLTTLGHPGSIHYLLKMLAMLVDADPETCFDLISEALLRTTGVARYEHESMGADLFVKLVGRFLADFRYIFDDDLRRARLVECIAIFVNAGWPEARLLFQNLPDLLQ